MSWSASEIANINASAAFKEGEKLNVKVKKLEHRIALLEKIIYEKFGVDDIHKTETTRGRE